MRPRVAGGWEIKHLTDRVVELRKDDPAYLRFTGRPGFVRVRAEPGMDRPAVLAKAEQLAARNDEEIATRVARQLMPSVRSLAEYRAKQARYAPAFRVPGQEPEQRIYRA